VYIRVFEAIGILLAALLASAAETSEVLSEPLRDAAEDDYTKAGWYFFEPPAFGEQGLFNLAQGDSTHIYRFSCSAHLGSSINVWLHIHKAGNGTVTIARNHIQLTDQGPNVWLSRDYAIDVPAVSKFLRLIESMDFWNMRPRVFKRPDPSEVPFWKLEGKNHGIYHSVLRERPEVGGFREAVLLLLSYGGLDGACEPWSGYLGHYKLGTLKYIGYVVTGDPPKPLAIVKTPDGLVEKARVGDGLGINFGRVREITENFIRTTELLSNGRGGLIEREQRLYRQGLPPP
jgi:hypothetical protein